jgi:hypothetical protein
MGYMEKILKTVPEKLRDPPEGVVQLRINADTGLRDESSSLSDWFLNEFTPRRSEESLAPAAIPGAPAQRDVRDQLFPGRSEVVADWYTGTMIIPKGKIVDYVHMGYGSTYERYTVIWIRHGDVTRQLDLRANQFMALRKQRFKAYQQTPEYQKQFTESLQQREGGTAAEIEDFLFEFDAERYLSIDPDAVDQ